MVLPPLNPLLKKTASVSNKNLNAKMMLWPPSSDALPANTAPSFPVRYVYPTVQVSPAVPLWFVGAQEPGTRPATL